MGSPSPRKPDESSRQYERLLKGEINSRQYVKSLKKDARVRVRNQRVDRRRETAA